MKLQLILFLIFAVGAIFSSWMCIVTSKRVYNERMKKIEKEIKALGGNIISIKQMKRTDCPLNNEYKDIELSYKFYKVKYALEDKLKEGWAILGMKQDQFRPNGAIKSKWMWRL